jgi:adenylate kinase family enzyme
MDKKGKGSFKLIIIGNGGTGKSTLGNSLSMELNVPVVHLDKLRWKENYEVVPEEEFKQQLSEIMQTERMIIEGWSDHSTMHDRMKWADIIIYLKYPLDICLKTVLRRNEEYSGKSYPFDNFTGNRVAKNDLYIKAVESVHYELEPEARKWMEELAGEDKTIVTYSSFADLNEHYPDLLAMLKERL